MVENYIGCVPMGNLPNQLSAIQVDGGEDTVGRFDEWQTVNIDSTPTACGRSSSGRRRCLGRRLRFEGGIKARLGLANLRRVGCTAEARAFIEPEWPA